MKFFVVCPRGLEGPLHDELNRIISEALNSQHAPLKETMRSATVGELPLKPTGGIECSGSLALAMILNLQSRVASRILLQVFHSTYKQEEDIYQVARKIAWEDWFNPDQTLRVDVTAQRSNLTSLNFVTLRIKDAICDRFREITGSRPTIETATPDVRVMAFLDATHITLYIDTSGEPLFKRGWRDEKGAAPLKENLAAGILALTGWQPEQPLFDPMCGSGTILIEAAQIAKRIAPGVIRAGILGSSIDLNQVNQLLPSMAQTQLDNLNEVEKTEKSYKELTEPDQVTSKDSLQNNSSNSVWQAPILVETGKPLVSVSNPPLVKKRVDQIERAENSLDDRKKNQKDLRKDSVALYKPSRVDLVNTIQGFGFSRLRPFQENTQLELWQLMKEDASQLMQQYEATPLFISGSDINEQMVAICKRNWQKAYLPGTPSIVQIDALQVKAPNLEAGKTGIIIFNPPYGERLEIKGGGKGVDDTERKQRGARDPLPKNISDPEFVDFLVQFGRHLKDRFDGWQMDILTADMGLAGQLRMKETKRTPLFNGAIECRLFRFQIRKVRESSLNVNKDGLVD